MSFHCEECGFKNNEIQSGGVIQEKGVRITVTLANERDLSRQVLFTIVNAIVYHRESIQVVRSDSASVLVPAIDLEIPATGQKGEVVLELKAHNPLFMIYCYIGDNPGGFAAAHNLGSKSRPGCEESSPP